MKRDFNKMQFAHQIRTFSLIIYIVIFILCGSLYLIMANNMAASSENNTLEYNMQVIENNMDRLISTVNDYSRIISYSDSVQNALKEESVTDYINIQDLQDAVIRMASSCEGISSVYLLNNKGEAYIAGNIYEGNSIKEQLQNSTWFQDALKQDSNYSINSEIITYKNNSSQRRKSVSFLRVINNLETLESMGLLVINIPYEKVEETYRSVGNADGIKTMVLDKKGDIVASSIEDSTLEEKILSSDLQGEPGKYVILDHNGTRYKIGEVMATDGEWKIISAISRTETLSIMRKYTLFYVLIMALGIALCIFGTSFITQRISVPLQNVLTSMEKVEQGKFERIKEIQVNQETNELQEKYNQMLDDTEALMVQKVEEQRQRRKYELSLLQMQIKPHFLYNTLDSITWMIEGERNDEAVFMISQLARLFRISLSKGHTIISIKDELQHAQSYMNIQKVRYKNKFQISFDIAPDILECCIVKLILQPILENAINYGVREMDDCGEIIVRGSRQKDEILLSVTDNGMGIPEEEVEFLLTDTKRVHKKGSGVGLVNVNNRIKILFGEQYGLHIESELDEGTTVSIKIPAIIYSEENRKKFESSSQKDKQEET